MLRLGMGLWQDACRPGWDADALAYIAQVEAADGAPLEPKVKLAINRFIRRCKRDASPVAGISNWQAMKASCLLAGPSTLSGAFVPLKGPLPHNFGFVSGDYHPSTGLKGNGTTSKYLMTNYYDEAPNSLHFATWATTPPPVGTLEGLLGQAGPTPGVLYRDGVTTGVGVPPVPHLAVRLNHALLVRIDLGGLTDDHTTGFFGVMRHPGDPASAYYEAPRTRGSVAIPESATTSTSNYRIFHNGGTAFPSSSRLSFYSLGAAIDLEKLHVAMAAYMEGIA